MTLTKTGGFAGLLCAATYLFGFALLVSLLAPYGYGTNQLDTAGIAALIDARPGIMIAWNTVIYIVNALALLVLVVALSTRLAPSAPGWAQVAKGAGMIWAALVLGAGMIANTAVERAATLYPTDPAGAAEAWHALHLIELGLGGGNEIAGGFWILTVSIAALRSAVFSRALTGLGIVIGLSGLLTIMPPAGEIAGALFGLGAIVWFIWVGLALLRSR